MGEQLGSVYVEVQARADKLNADLETIRARFARSASEIEAQFARTRITINTSLATKSLQEVEAMQRRLQATLANKIALNLDMASITRTTNALNVVEAKLAQVRGMAAGGVRAPMIGIPGAAGVGKEVEGLSGIPTVFASIGKSIMSSITQMVAFGAALLGVQKIFSYFGSALEKWEERKIALQGITQTIHSMGREGEFTSSAILKMSERLADFNHYAVKIGEVLDLSNFLLTFEHISEETLPRASQVVIDLSKKMGVDLKMAAMSVGIALDNPAEGLMRLSRAGVRFTKDEKEVIQSLVDAGKSAEAQEMIFSKLEMKVGGAAKAMTDDTTYFQGKLTVAFEAVQRTIGKLIEEAIDPLLETFTQFQSKDLGAEFEMLSTKVAETNTKIKPLLSTYDDLQAKVARGVALTSTEHEKFTSILGTLMSAFPGAVNQWDQYGVAIGVSTERIREYIEAEQARLAWVNKAAIRETESKRIDIVREMKIIEEETRTGVRQTGVARAASGTAVVEPALILGEKDRAGNTARMKELQADLAGIEAQMRVLTGTPLKIDVKPITGVVEETKEALKARLDAERELDAAIRALNTSRIEDELTRQKKAIEDKRRAALAAIKAEELEAIKEKKPIAKETVEKKRQVVEVTYKTDMVTYDRTVKETHERTEKEFISAEEKYTNESKSLRRSLFDSQIKEYSLSITAFESYLREQLEDEVKSYELRNTERRKFNEEMDKQGHPERQVEMIDIHEIRRQSEAEIKAQVSTYKEGKQEKPFAEREKELRLWVKENQRAADVIQGMAGGIENAWTSAFDAMLHGEQSFVEGVKSGFIGMGEAVIAEIERMIAKMITFAALKAAFSWLPGAGSFITALFGREGGGFTGSPGGGVVPGMEGAAKGGVFNVSPKGIERSQSHGTFTIPPGYKNDSYPLMVESGERIIVIPSSKAVAGKTLVVTPAGEIRDYEKENSKEVHHAANGGVFSSSSETHSLIMSSKDLLRTAVGGGITNMTQIVKAATGQPPSARLSEILKASQVHDYVKESSKTSDSSKSSVFISNMTKVIKAATGGVFTRPSDVTRATSDQRRAASIGGLDVRVSIAGGPFIKEKEITRMAAGGTFIVPAGYQGDNFPLFVQSGERVSVTPSHRVAEQTAGYAEMLKKLDILNMNLASSSSHRGKMEGSLAVQVAGSLQGKDIYLSNKKASRVYTRIR